MSDESRILFLMILSVLWGACVVLLWVFLSVATAILLTLLVTALTYVLICVVSLASH